MISLAFKDAKMAGGWFSRAIAWKTGGKFSHVELWLDGPQENARCYSSREPKGTGYAHLNLETPLWTIVPIACSELEAAAVRWFCAGSNTREYDWLGILGFVWPWGEHNDHDRFCSEACTEILQKCMNLLPGVKPWMTSPSELYRLVTEKVQERAA